MKILVIATVAAVIGAGYACADEVWTTPEGEIVYETDIEANQTAVFKADGMRMYVEGLSGVYTNRGTYLGVWVLDEAPANVTGCSVEIVRPGTEGETTAFWGQFEITFIDPEFPSAWIADLGECFDGLNEKVIARPAIDQSAQ